MLYSQRVQTKKKNTHKTERQRQTERKRERDKCQT